MSGLNYKIKRTRHRKSEIYDLFFNNGLKAQVECVGNEHWQMIVSISSYSKLVSGNFTSLDRVAEYAHKTKLKEKEWIKTNVEFVI
jgi:hypothetical protein